MLDVLPKPLVVYGGRSIEVNMTNCGAKGDSRWLVYASGHVGNPDVAQVMQRDHDL
jgi:hypothetical protein